MFSDGSLKNLYIGLQPVLPSLLNEVFWENMIGTKCVEILKLLLSNETLLVSGSVFLGPSFAAYITSVYYSIKSFINYQLYVSVEIDDMDRVHRPIAAFISEKMEDVKLKMAQGEHDTRNNNRRFHQRRVQSDANPSIVLQPVMDTEHRFIYKGRTFWVIRLSEQRSGNVSTHGGIFSRLFDGMNKSSTRITMRGRDIKELRGFLQEWVEQYYTAKHNKLVVYKATHRRPGDCSWEEKVTKDVRPFDTVILKEGQKEDLVQDAKDFLDRQLWYADRGIPYRKGYLLSGPPGTGKTTVIRCLSGELGMQLASISLTGMNSDEEFENMVATAPDNSILLLEDVDHCLKVIEESKAPSSASSPQSGHITLPGLLNVMDGLDMRDGTIFFMTCNDISVLPAVMRRRGRIDKEIVLDYADEYQVRTMFDRFFRKTRFDNDSAAFNKVADKVANALPPGDFSTAELQGFFLDYYFYMDRHPVADAVAAFDDMFGQIATFKLDIEQNRRDRETRKQAELDKLKERILEDDKKNRKEKKNKKENKTKKNKETKEKDKEVQTISSASAPASPTLSPSVSSSATPSPSLSTTSDSSKDDTLNYK